MIFIINSLIIHSKFKYDANQVPKSNLIHVNQHYSKITTLMMINILLNYFFIKLFLIIEVFGFDSPQLINPKSKKVDFRLDFSINPIFFSISIYLPPILNFQNLQQTVLSFCF